MWTVSPGMERAVALLFLLLGATGAQIPIQCATVGHMQSSKCCPAYPGDGSPCGSASGRGSCRQVETPRERGDRERQSGGTADFRQWWPTYFYTRACACQGNYGGADCGECTYGWRGDHCQEKHTVVRRDLAKMGRDERRKFVSAMQTAKTTLSQRYVIYASEGATAGSRKGFRRATVFDVATWIHYICSKTLVTGTGPNFAHQSTAFLTWHKLYLLYLEKEIRNVTGDEGFFIPVWIWAGSDNCTVCTDDLFGGSRPDGRLTGPFGNWTTYCTDDNGMESSMDVICAPGNGQPIRRYNQADPWFGSLPTVEDVRATLSLTTYDTPPYNTFSENSFRAVLEGYMDPQSPTESTASMHNLVHIYCGGTLNDVLQSSNDPVFPSIHAYVDMIFEWWLRNNVEATYPTDDAQIPYGHRADDRIVPFAELYRNRDMMKRAEEFGYNYEYF